MEMPGIKSTFKNGDIVKHIRGGSGKIKHQENDWSTVPPTVMAIVEVMDTAFHNIRRIPIEDLRLL